jgi:glycosyltransferase involved in cell wall biosynthesis
VKDQKHNSESRTRIAVVSPFLDKQHGTERCVAEQVERLARGYEVYVYSNRVQDVDLKKIVWRRVPALPGPLLVTYCWWFLANHLWRWWDQRFRGLQPDLTYTPGINCLDADVISVHCVFSELRGQVKDRLSLRLNPVSSWARIVHRRLYYRLIMKLEYMVYSRKRSLLTAISRKTAEGLKRYGRGETPVIYYGLDAKRFNPQIRQRLREPSRKGLGLPESALCLLLVGNGWENKGLASLLEALGSLARRDWRLLVVGQDDPGPYRRAMARNGLEPQVAFLPPRPDVEFYYASADAYVGPSLEDAFGLPPLEAMACGLPVIVSSRAGVSEAITDGVDGFVLADPRDSGRLADLMVLLYDNNGLRQRIGEAAAKTARQYSWDRNAEQLDQLFQEVLRRKSCERAPVPSGQPVR